MISTATRYQAKSDIQQCKRNDLFYGITNTSITSLAQLKGDKPFFAFLADYARTFPVIEWKTDLQTLVDEAVLSHIAGVGFHSVLIHVNCIAHDFQPTGRLMSVHWHNFIASIQSLSSSTRFHIIVSFDTNMPYSIQLLEAFCQLQEYVHPIKLIFECEHRSWKNPASIRIFRETKINIVQRDIPSLSGFAFVLPNYDRKLCVVRLLGRNKISWFSPEPNQRFKYDYTKDELVELSRQIKLLKEDCDEVIVIGVNRPAKSALSNILELAHLSINS